MSIVMFVAIALIPVWLFGEGLINGLMLGITLVVLIGLFVLFIWWSRKKFKDVL